MKASDLFLKCLEEMGVEYIFGVPGEENADIMISLLDSKIKFVTCRHEQTASFAAGMYGHLTGKPGVCLATLGPGATNLITGVANSNMDNAPVIAVIGQASTHRLHKESHQNMDSVSMYKPATKWATTIRDADVIPEVLAKAFKISTEGRPGAVLVELPEDIAALDTKAQSLGDYQYYVGERADSEKIDAALDIIREAKNPLILAGAGAVREECDAEIRALMDKTGIYGATTFMGKGSIDTRHEHSLYCVGLGMKDIAVEAFDEADCVIAIGYGMVEWPPARWNAKGDKKIIHIGVDLADVDRDYIPEIELIGNIKHTLTLLNEKLMEQHQKKEPGFAKLRKKVIQDLQVEADSPHFPMKPQRILKDLRGIMRDDDILISDVGAHKMWVARQYDTYLSKTCYISNGFCSMGCAMPSAMVAKYHHPDKHVVALCGDGGFVMSIQALPTAVHYKIPMVVLVWEDDHYGLIKWKQEMHFNGQFSHVDLQNHDLVALARGFGCHAKRVEATEELVPEMQKAFKQDLPTVIVVPVDYSENMKLFKHLGEIVSR